MKVKNIVEERNEKIEIGLPENIRVVIGDLTVDFYTETQVTRESSNSPSEIHFHAMFEFQYVYEGTMCIVTERDTISVNPGEFILIPPRVPHRTDGSHGVFRRSSIAFTLSTQGARKGQFSEYEYYNRIFEAMDDVVVLTTPEICECLQRIRKMEGMEADFVEHKATIELSLLLTELAETVQKQLPVSADSACARKKELSVDGQRKWIIEYFVSVYYRSEDPAESLMKILCMSRRNVDRVVCKVMGESLHALILRQRMIIAKELLENSEMRLNAVAEAVGYRSYVGFYTAFRNYYGFAPDQFRRKTETKMDEEMEK